MLKKQKTAFFAPIKRWKECMPFSVAMLIQSVSITLKSGVKRTYTVSEDVVVNGVALKLVDEGMIVIELSTLGVLLSKVEGITPFSDMISLDEIRHMTLTHTRQVLVG